MGRPVRRVALVGPPGAWRKPHARRLGRALEVPVLSVGALIDHEVRQGSRSGLAAAAAIERGGLAPDDVVCELLAPRLAAMPGGWVLDGFPRTVAQARWMLRTPAAIPDTVIEVDVPVQTMLSTLDEESDPQVLFERAHLEAAATQTVLAELEDHVQVCTVNGARSSPELAVDLLHATMRVYAPA